MPLIFDYDAWILRYPEFRADVDELLAGEYWAEAALYFPERLVQRLPADRAQRLQGMLCAHIAALNAQLGGMPSSTLVGRITNASEGSASVQTEYGSGQTSAAQAWLVQTKYGAAYWQATQAYRNFHYVLAPRPRVSQPYPFVWRP